MRNDFTNTKEATGPLLFHPGEKNLKRIYPELAKYDEFDSLTETEMRFCYYYGVYYDHIEGDSKRLKLALWKIGSRIDEATRKAYQHNKMPTKVKAAMAKMQQFDIKLRFRAKKMTEQILENFEQVTSLTTEDFKTETGSVDMDSLKKHIDLCINISKELPNIVQKAEAGYGVRTITLDNKQLTQGSPLDEYLRTERL